MLEKALPAAGMAGWLDSMEPVLRHSSGISLHVLRAHEAGTLFTLINRNRQHLREWLPWVDASRDVWDTRRFLERSYGSYLRGGGFSFGIQRNRELVGVIGFHGFDTVNRVTSLGYWLAEEACGQGLMRAGVDACVSYAFGERGMNRLYVRCATGNLRSRKVAEALGFVHEGTQREAEWLYDHFADLEVYSVLAREWRERSSGDSL
ncbi:MAG: GNAT family protein [Oceanipulchritudo sp.]